MQNSEKHCKTCCHWKSKDESDNWSNDDGEYIQKASEWGNCITIKHCYWQRADLGTLAVTMDGSDYHSRLNTHMSFGCVLHEVKP